MKKCKECKYFLRMSLRVDDFEEAKFTEDYICKRCEEERYGDIDENIVSLEDICGKEDIYFEESLIN